MPADSEPAIGPPIALPMTWRPTGVRIAGWAFGLALFVVCVVAWRTFDPAVRAAITPAERVTLLALGVGTVVALHALMRCKVRATVDGLIVVNGYRRRELTWPEVLAVSLPSGAPWATLDLADGTSVSAMGIQGSDGAGAHRAVRQLRTLLNQ
jgi:Bacterial PH domain